MLTKKLPIHLVTGIVVYRAHKYVTLFWYTPGLNLYYMYIVYLVTKPLSVQVRTMFDCCAQVKSRIHWFLYYLFWIDRIIESCQEAFILRLYRENNKVPFIE